MKKTELYFAVGLIVTTSGCTSIAQKTIRATGAVAKTTIKVGGEVTKTAVTTTLDLAGAAFKKGAVTLVDATGVRKKIPWTKGLDIAAASQQAKIKTTTQAIEILRGAKKIAATANTLLKPDDIVRIK